MTTAVLAETPQLGALDLWIIGIYMVLLLGLGGILERLVKDSEDMFAAGGESPWWLSGISAYMTMFSSGTFVVWGGIAYKGGMVAVSICMTLGISALLVGMFWAGKWKASGATSAAEFIGLRYGPGAVQTYTWLGLLVRVIGAGVALYSVAVLICALIPIGVPEGGGLLGGIQNLLRDDSTGRLSVVAGILMVGVVVVVISGNLWAVLVTDTLQFIVLTASVLIVVPLLFQHEAVGGIGGFIESARNLPALFDSGSGLVVDEGKSLLSPTSGKFTWLFLGGWIVIHMFKIGGEWAFVQRFLCVPTKRDAAKVGLIFGGLYIVSPLIWMLPPMIFRVMHPIDPAMSAGEVKLFAEQAYILACAAVLPTGMIGLMVAAMFSATVSMVDSEINVYAGALTRDIYARVFNVTDDRKLVKVGRIMTTVLGLLVIGMAISVPHLGGAQSVILTITGLFVGPMVLPTIWGLFSKHVGLSAVFVTALIGAAVSAILKFVLNDVTYLQEHARTAEVMVGLIPPFITLLVLEVIGRKRGVHPNWTKIEEMHDHHHQGPVTMSSGLPRIIVAWSMVALACVFFLVTAVQSEHRLMLGISGAVLAVLGLWAGSLKAFTNPRALLAESESNQG